MTLQEMTEEELLGQVYDLRTKLAERDRVAAELQEANQFLRERAKIFDALVYSAPEPMVVYDAEGRALSVNPAFITMFGWSREELLGRRIDYVPEKCRAHTRETMERSLKGEHVPPFETKRLTKDGRVLDIQISAALFRNDEGQPSGHIVTLRDISQVKRSEEARQKSEEQYRLLTERISDIVWTADLNLRITYISPSIVRALGFTPEERTNQRPEETMTSESYERARALLMEELARELKHITEPNRTITIELEYYRKDGSTLWFENKINAIRDEAGNISEIQGISRDISDRKRAQDALRESEQKYRLLVDHVQEAIFVAQDGMLKFVNPKTMELIQYTESDLLSNPFTEFIHPDDRGMVLENHVKRLQGGEFRQRYIFRIIHKSGAIRWVELDGVVIQWEGRPATLAFLSDITERKNSEEALRESEDRYRTLVENLNDVIFSVDLEGRLTYISPVFERKSMYTCQEAIGRRFTDFMHPDDLPRLMERYARVMDGDLAPTEHRLVDKDGRIVHIRSHSRSVYRDGKVVGLTGLMTDITELKKAEEERSALRDQLREAQKMEAIGTLAGGIAHDFNNLLQVTLGYAEVMLADKPEDDADREDLEKIRQAALSGAELVKGLLTFSRRVASEPMPLNLNSRIEQIEPLLRRTIPRMIEICFDLAADLKLTNVDPAQIEQILVNLFINARDAMPAGGVLTVGTRNVTLEDDVFTQNAGYEAGDYVLLYVSDTGHGMNRETQERIFEPFYTTKALGRGTGLGLAMVYGIMQQHHGCIRCHSAPERGTTFRLYFRAITDHAEPEMPEAAPMPAFGTETLLLVDDELAVRELGTRILSKAGYRVLAAENGQQALELFQKEREEISLVILDFIMPQMSGVDCLREILGIDSRAKILIASGHAADTARQECVSLGATGFVGKPFRLRQLLEHVRNALDRR